MIRLVYADRAPRLVEALAEQIHRARTELGRSPLEPIPIVVPDQAATAYLKMAIAEQLGIAGNLTFTYIRNYLADLVHETSPELQIVDAARLEVLLVDVLSRPVIPRDPDLQPVLRYLDAAGDDEPARDLRRAQLASLLARLYDEYILTRPEMIAAWQSTAAPPSRAVERWERALWRILKDTLAEHGLVTITEAFDRFSAPQDILPAQLHVWDVSVGGSVLQTVLARLAEHTDLWLYTLNPCLEFWEDVQAGPDLAFLRSRLEPRPARVEQLPGGEDPFGLEHAEADTPALRLWGRPGRENIRLLNALTDCDFEARFSDVSEPPASLLAQLGRDILLREPERASPLGIDGRYEDDESLRFVACASVRREVEAIAQQIWALVERSAGDAKPLRFSDVAVVLTGPEQDAYRAHIGAVFQERHRIPHHTMDVPLSGSSRVVEAVELLLALPHSGFTRQDLLRLVTHPVVLARYDDVTADDWVTWCEELAVVHGADHADHAETYITRDLYNWDQGIRRLTLGTFMSGGLSGDRRRFVASGQSYLPYEYPLDRITDAARLIGLVRSLIADARFARDARMPLADWAEFIRILVSTYVTAANDQDERDLLRVLAALQHLGELDATGAELGFRSAAELARARLTGLTSNRGQPLTEGVVVAPLSLVASLPFRVVFMPGLQEGRFPASERRNQLDLRGGARRVGDVSARERDQYWFLQRLLSTQDSLHLSWVSRSSQTGDPLAPAPTVTELLTILSRGYLGVDAETRIDTRPLRRYAEVDDSGFDAQAALRERQILSLRSDLAAHLTGPDEIPGLDVLRTRLPSAQWAPLARRLGLAEPPAVSTTPPARIEVPYRVLRRFLEDPLQGWAELVLGLRQDDIEADPYAREDELFRTESPDEERLLREVFLAHLREPDAPLDDLYAQHAEQLELSGTMPTGVFKESEHRRHVATLNAWRGHLRRALAGRVQPLEPLRFGRAAEHTQVHAVAEPVLVPLPDGRVVALSGSTEPLTSEPDGSFTVRVRDPLSGPRARVPELRSFLDMAIRAARKETFASDYRGWVAYSTEGQEGLHRVSYESFTPEAALAWLADVLRELLDESHAYTLPFTAIVGLYEARNKGSSSVEEVLAKARPAGFGPLPGSDVPPPSAEHALEILERRFGPWFARRREEGP